MAIANKSTPILRAALLRLLRPLVSLLIKNGVSYKTFADITKWLFYDVARTDFTIDGRKQTLARICVLTGLSRRDARNLAQQAPPTDTEHTERYNRGARVISGWYRDVECLDKRGRPKTIPIKGAQGSFEGLVKRYSGDMPTRAVLDELERIGALEVTSKNRVRLVKDAFVPKADDDIKFNILGSDVGFLLSTMEHNLDPETGTPFYQRKVNYDNLPEEALPKIREVAGRRANTLLNVMDNYLAPKDRDVSQNPDGSGRYEAGIGIYYFERPFSEKVDESTVER